MLKCSKIQKTYKVLQQGYSTVTIIITLYQPLCYDTKVAICFLISRGGLPF